MASEACPCCGIVQRLDWFGGYCEACAREAMHRLGVGISYEGDDFDGRRSEHAHWRVPGLLATWTRNGTRRRLIAERRGDGHGNG